MARLDDAISHLSCALGQVVPSDDAIIVGHMRDALELLRTEEAVRAVRARDEYEADGRTSAAEERKAAQADRKYREKRDDESEVA